MLSGSGGAESRAHEHKVRGGSALTAALNTISPGCSSNSSQAGGGFSSPTTPREGGPVRMQSSSKRSKLGFLSCFGGSGGGSCGGDRLQGGALR